MSQKKSHAGQGVAAHPEDPNHDKGRAEPGAGLDRRQARNARQTEDAAGTAQAGHRRTDKPDPTNP